MRVFLFLTTPVYDPTQGFYADHEQNPDQMSLVKRHHLTLAKREEIQELTSALSASSTKTPASYQPIADCWDFILRYGVLISQSDLSLTTRVYHDAAFHSNKDFSKAVAVLDRLFKEHPDNLLKSELYMAACTYYNAALHSNKDFSKAVAV